jgi:membrane protease YdiL (CAAX protease family)
MQHDQKTELDIGMKPTSQTQPRFEARVYLLGLLAFPLFFLVNYLYNHQRELLAWLPQGRPTYFLAVLLPFGTLLPCLALAWFVRRLGGAPRAFGTALAWRDLLYAVLAFVFGGVAVYFAVGRSLAQNADALGTVIHLFIWLLIASIPEVLVFNGLIFNAVEAGVRQVLGGRAGQIAGAVGTIVVSAVAFGLFHFSYYPPWDTWDKAMSLIPVWLAVATFYALTRSLAAAVIFDNLLAVVGFVRNQLSIPGSNLLGLALDAIAIVAVVVIVAVLCSTRKEVQKALSSDPAA